MNASDNTRDSLHNNTCSVHVHSVCSECAHPLPLQNCGAMFGFQLLAPLLLALLPLGVLAQAVLFGARAAGRRKRRGRAAALRLHVPALWHERVSVPREAVVAASQRLVHERALVHKCFFLPRVPLKARV